MPTLTKSLIKSLVKSLTKSLVREYGRAEEIPAPDYRWLPGEIENGGVYSNGPTYRMGRVGEGSYKVLSNCFDVAAMDYFNNDGMASVLHGIEGGFTICAWVRHIQGAGTRPIMQSGSISAGQDGFRFAVTGNGSIQLRSNGVNINSITSRGLCNDGVWHHITAAYDGVNVRLYIDKVLVRDPTPLAFNVISASTMKIGSNGNGTSEWWDGLIDDVRVYKGVALSFRQINELVDFTQAFDTSQINPTAFFDSYDQTKITYDGNDITLVENKGSLTGLNLGQTDPLKRMTGLTATLNGVPAFASSPAEQFLEAEVDIQGSGTALFLIVTEIFSTQNNLSALFSIESEGETIRINSGSNPVFKGRSQLTVEGQSITYSPDVGVTPAIHIVTLDWNEGVGGVMEAFVNGVSQGTAPYTNTRVEGESFVRLFQKNSPSITASPEGNATFFVIDDDISPDNRVDLEGEYAWIHGIPLPVGHKYEFEPPKKEGLNGTILPAALPATL